MRVVRGSSAPTTRVLAFYFYSMLSVLAIISIFAAITIVVVLAICIARVLFCADTWSENGSTHDRQKTHDDV